MASKKIKPKKTLKTKDRSIISYKKLTDLVTIAYQTVDTFANYNYKLAKTFERRLDHWMKSV